MVDLRIVDAPVLLQESITDDVKMPTGGLGNYAIRLGDLVWYVVAKENLASKSYVDTSSQGVQDKVDIHVADKNNPHQVTKEQVGLGNVDNTADLDKPVSAPAKTYIDQQDALKADSATTYSKSEVDSKVNAVSGGYFKAFDTLAALNATTGMTAGQVAKVMSDSTATNNGDYYYNGGAWVKGYNSLDDAKKYTDAKVENYTNNAIDLNNAIIEIDYKTTNLINPNQVLNQGYFNSVGVQPYPSVPNYVTGDDFYPVKPSQKLWTKNVVGGQVIQFYDANKNVIMWYDSNNIVNGVLTVPSSVNGKVPAFMKIGTNVGETNWRNGLIAIGYGDTVPNPIPAYGQSSIKPTQAVADGIADTLGLEGNKLSGKTWLAIGDSITNSAVAYANVLATRHNATLIKHSEDGARVHRQLDNETWRILSETYVNISGVTPDIITVAAGVNDQIGAEQLGTFTDRTIRTFYGALHVLLSGLREKFTDARIGYIAPIPNTGGYVDGDITNYYYLKYKAIKEVANYYGIPVWNGNAEFSASPRDTAWMNKYMPDGLHPNKAGHIWYANRVEQFVLNLAK